MELAGGRTCALQTRVIHSSGDASDYLLACGFVRGRISHEHGNRNLPSIRQWDEPYVVRRVRYSIVYVGVARLVGDLHSIRQITVETSRPISRSHPGYKQISMFRISGELSLILRSS